MSLLIHRCVLFAALAALASGPVWAQAPLPKATPAEQATLQKFVQAYMRGLEDNDYYEVLAEEVALRIQGGKKDFVVVDVRIPKDKKYDRGHIPGAIHVNLLDLVQPETLARLPRDKEIHVICRSGGRAYYATRILLQNGFKARNISGGMLARSHRATS